MGGKVGRLDVGKIGRFEGGKARKNLMEAYTFHNSFLIPSTHKFFVGDLRSPTTNKIYSPARELQESFKIASKITPFGAKSLVVLVLN